jgi:hypothetical protein
MPKKKKKKSNSPHAVVTVAFVECAPTAVAFDQDSKNLLEQLCRILQATPVSQQHVVHQADYIFD